MIALPVGSALLTAGWLLLAGGFGGLRRPLRRAALVVLGAVIAAHLAALWQPALLPWCFGVLCAGALALALPSSLHPLSLCALSAALATVVLIWPGSFENALDPLLATGLAAAAVAALLAPAGAEAGVAALAAAAGALLLRESLGDLAAPPPDLETGYQLIGVALVAGYALAALRRRIAPRLWGGAANV